MNIPDFGIRPRLHGVHFFALVNGVNVILVPQFARLGHRLVVIDDAGLDFPLDVLLVPLDQLHPELIPVDLVPQPSHFV